MQHGGNIYLGQMLKHHKFLASAFSAFAEFHSALKLLLGVKTGHEELRTSMEIAIHIYSVAPEEINNLFPDINIFLILWALFIHWDNLSALRWVGGI